MLDGPPLCLPTAVPTALTLGSSRTFVVRRGQRSSQQTLLVVVWSVRAGIWRLATKPHLGQTERVRPARELVGRAEQLSSQERPHGPLLTQTQVFGESAWQVSC